MFEKRTLHALDCCTAGVQPAYPALFESEFKRPTLLPATLQCAWGPAVSAGLLGQSLGTGGLL